MKQSIQKRLLNKKANDFFYKLNQIFRKIGIIFLLRIKNFSAFETIIIFSEARGGSTWLMEMLNDTLEICINWEPLHVEKGVVPKAYNFGWRPFIPRAAKNEDYSLLFENIHEYKVYSNWTLSRLKFSKLIRSKQVLVKYVRANMLIPYILERFQFKHAPILLIRHPIDICLSQMKAFSKHQKIEGGFKVPECINNQRFIENKEYLNQLTTDLEKAIAIWCLNNCYTINQISRLENLHIIYYADLLLYPEKEIEKYLFKNKLEKYSKNLGKVNFRKVSSTDFNGEFRTDSNEQLFKNFRMLNKEVKLNVQKIFDHFELKLFTAFSPFPLKDSYLT